MMLAHLFSQLLVISVQITLLLLFILLVFNVSKRSQGDPFSQHKQITCENQIRTNSLLTVSTFRGGGGGFREKR